MASSYHWRNGDAWLRAHEVERVLSDGRPHFVEGGVIFIPMDSIVSIQHVDYTSSYGPKIGCTISLINERSVHIFEAFEEIIKTLGLEQE